MLKLLGRRWSGNRLLRWSPRISPKIWRMKEKLSLCIRRLCVDRIFCLAQSYYHLVPKKHIEDDINYKLFGVFGILAQSYY